MKTFQLEANGFFSSVIVVIAILLCNKISAQNILPIISQSIETSSNIRALFVSKEGYLLRLRNDTLEYINENNVIWKSYLDNSYKISSIAEDGKYFYLTVFAEIGSDYNSSLVIIDKLTGVIKSVKEISKTTEAGYEEFWYVANIKTINENTFIVSSLYFEKEENGDFKRFFGGIKMINSDGRTLGTIYLNDYSLLKTNDSEILNVVQTNDGFLILGAVDIGNADSFAWISKVDKFLNIVWVKILNGAEISALGDKSGLSAFNNEIILLSSDFLFKFDHDGDLLKEKSLDHSKSYNSMAKMCHNKFVLFGNTKDNKSYILDEFNYDLEFSKTIYSDTVRKTAFFNDLKVFGRDNNSFILSGRFSESDGNNFTNKSLTIFTGIHPDCIKSSTLKINDAEGVNNQEVYVDISVESFNNVLANEFSIQWPTDKLELVSVPSGSDIKISGTTLFNETLLSQGKIGLFWESADLSLGTTLADNTVIYRFKFKILANNGSQVEVQSSDEPLPGKLIDINGEVNVNIQSGTVSVGTSSSKDSDINQIKLMPNPTTGIVTIQSPYAINTITLIDLIGRKLPLSNIGNQIDVSNYQPGKYILSIHHQNGVSNLPLILIK